MSAPAPEGARKIFVILDHTAFPVWIRAGAASARRQPETTQGAVTFQPTGGP
jgi:hypothetical protein